jgi:hypothetical protein
MSQTMRSEASDKKRVTHTFTEPIFVRTTSSNVPRIRIADITADIEIHRRHESRRGKMADFPQLVLRDLSTDRSLYFSATPSVIKQITSK